MPMVEPMIAMAFERWLSRVRSAVSAITTAEIAPAPCSMRPRITIQMPLAEAATKLPRANSTRPKYMTGLRP